MIEVLQKWMIAELKSLTLTGSPNIYRANINYLPSHVGVFVAMGATTEASRNISDQNEVRVIVLANSEQRTLTVMREIMTAFHFYPGMEKVWQASPSDHSIRIRDVQRITVLSPESTGEGNKNYTGTIVFRVRGEDTR